MHEGKIERYYLSGALRSIEYYLDGLRHGIFMTFFEGGEKQSVVSYHNGLLHGEFALYSLTGLKRKGQYVLGKKKGMHQIWDEKGALLVEAEFANGEPIRFFRKYYPGFGIREELFYHDKHRFDKRCYSLQKVLEYEGIFAGNRFIEKRFEGDQAIKTREGTWNGSRVVWD